MKRRHVLTAAAALATGASTIAVLGRPSKQIQGSKKSEFSAPSIGKGLKQLRLVTSWPKDFPGLGVMANRFSEYVNTMTGGSIEIKVYSAGELVGATEVFDAV